jgi:hypothetical protein
MPKLFVNFPLPFERNNASRQLSAKVLDQCANGDHQNLE